ncbi:LPS translocon maturation chaperone LptM [Psychrobacter sp. FDAARGOS_221]|uniref:LPS translocon maturation chaperone LptM n=1 Tax=Psychrobacter sp. FDAARGOS_221 TaxID=1975705 RepID=UPI000BB55332|nr:lipoprotein [Psychrobacter sp. FDAARGOS_221]PNK60405.1 hypothetical protein A6J60_005645 [Psychrobacter sp. FDAARGOS_221]
MLNVRYNTDKNLKARLIDATKISAKPQLATKLSSITSMKGLYSAKRCRAALLTAVLITPVLLTGCGQSGDLYLTKDAPSNTDFILYKGNKSEDAKPTIDYTQQEVQEAAAENPADY